MGCVSSKPTEQDDPSKFAKTTVASYCDSSGNIDVDSWARKSAGGKTIKLLLLGAGESGKSTIFKQLRLLYGADQTERELLAYKTAIRSNTVAVARKLCTLLRDMGLEGELDEESSNKVEGGSMTYRQAYDELVAHLVDAARNSLYNDVKTAPPEQEAMSKGKSIRAALMKSKKYIFDNSPDDAKLLMIHHEAIQILWQSATMQKVCRYSLC